MSRLNVFLSAAILLLGCGAGYLWYQHSRPWQEWLDFSRSFISDDGRVIDRTANQRSTSEGQAYALFFALVANDRPAFDRLLTWTRNNLVNGDFASQLPAWLWGQKSDGSWGVIDANGASDADLWMAYALLEAGRIWKEPRYTETGQIILFQVKSQVIGEVSQIGPMLVPGSKGFRLENGNWRFNPSYLPEFQFRYLSRVDAQGPWHSVWQSHLKLMQMALSGGVAPDWFEVDTQGVVLPDTVLPHVGSYDAIRVYLWAGMTPEGQGVRNRILELTQPFAALIAQRKFPPEKTDPLTRSSAGGQPLGFSAAVLPYLHALSEDATARLQLERLVQNRVNGSLGDPAHYYDQVLALFGEGWVHGRFRFDIHGQLITKWQTTWLDRWLP